MSKRSLSTLFSLFTMLFLGATAAHAQSVSAYFGLGSANDSSNNQSLDTIGDTGPSLGGLFGTIGGDVMIKPTLGFGAEYVFHPTQTSYAPEAGVNYRPLFYDFNAIWQPALTNTRLVPELQAGVGGADLKFYETETECAVAGVCSTLNQYIASSNHFQVHFGAGLRFYVKNGIFVRPQFDLHWVNNFQEFGRSWVPQYSVAVGYTFGRR